MFIFSAGHYDNDKSKIDTQTSSSSSLMINLKSIHKQVHLEPLEIWRMVCCVIGGGHPSKAAARISCFIIGPLSNLINLLTSFSVLHTDVCHTNGTRFR